MTDFVRILQNYCNSKSISYHHGKRANLNLLKSDLDIDKIYCLHEPSPRKTEMNTNKTKVASYLFSGMFFLVKKSSPDMPYLNEMGNSEDISKYKLNIEPLLNEFKIMANYFGCTDMELLQLDAIDVVDVLDTNKDGLLITYSIRSFEY
jgi:hypothetical protein